MQENVFLMGQKIMGEKISFTPEQIIDLLSHSVTQNQLDSTRRELSEKMDSTRIELNEKIEKNSDKIDKLQNIIDRRSFALVGLLLTNLAAIVAAAFYLGQHIH